MIPKVFARRAVWAFRSVQTTLKLAGRKFWARMSGWVVAGVIAAMTFIAPAHAIEVAVPFNEGFVGVVGTNTQKANNITTFASMGITRMVFSQVSSGNTFELSLQGNDIPGTLRLYQGAVIIDIPGSIVWRWPNQSPYSLGFIPSASTTISYGSGQSYAITAGGNSGNSNIGIKVNNSSVVLTNGDNISGNAANMSSVLDSLNTYLAASVTAAPAGPVTVTAQKTNDTTPTLAGTVTLGAGDTLQVTVNGVVYTTSNGLAVSGSTWSLTLPTLPVGTYSVEALIIGSTGYTKADSTAGELQIDTTGPIVTGPSGSGTTTGNASKSVNEGTLTVATFTAPETVTWSVSGTDAAKFSISAGGALTFVSAPDYEVPSDAGADRIYNLTVTALDAFGNTTTQIVTVTVLNVEPEATSVGSISGRVETRSGAAVLGASVKLINAGSTVVKTTTSASDGSYSFADVTPGTYSIEFVTSSGRGAKGKSATGTVSGRFVQSITVESGVAIASVNAVLVDPSGVVYDSTTRAPVAGAVVRLLYNNALVPDSQLDTTLGGTNTQTVGLDGLYTFVLNGTAQTGAYTLSVTPPTGYTFTSTAILPTASSFTPDLGGGIQAIQAQATAPTGSEATTYHLTFNFTITTDLATTSNGVVQNHIPIDPNPNEINSTITASPTSVLADGSTTSTLTVQLKDANGNNLTAGGQTVTLTSDRNSTLGTDEISAVTDNGDGTYTFTVKSTVSGLATFTGTVGGATIVDTASVTFTVGAASTTTSTLTASPTSVLADGSTTSTLTVQLKDANGNNLTAGGQTVTLTSDRNSTLGTDEISAVTDNGDGTYTFTVKSTVSGLATFTGTVGGATIVDTASVTFTVGAASTTTSTLTASPTSVLADGSTTSTLTVQLKDANGNNLTAGGQTVTLTSDRNSTLGTDEISAVTDNGDGTYTFTVKSTVSGLATFTGTVGGATIVDTASVTFTVGAASTTTSTLTASPTSVLADGSTTSTLTVQLKDANGNNLTAGGQTISLTSDRNSTLGTDEISAVTDNGDGTYTFTVKSTVSGLATFTGTVGGATIVDTETVTFFNGPVLSGPDGVGGTTTTADFAISLPEGGTAVTQILSDVAITTWALSGDDAARFLITSDGLITFLLPTNFEAPVDAGGNNNYVLTISATDGAGNTVTRTLTVTITDLVLPGTPPALGTDNDGDGVADNLESSSADRDGDGIPDAQDFDPQGYFYCQADGRILPGGVVTVTGPIGSHVTMVSDGSATGEYQWFVDAPGTYTMAIDPSGTGYTTLAVNSAGQLTLADQVGNPIVIGNTQNAATGYLGAFNGVPYNPAATPLAYYTSFVIAEGDANVFGNNIPMANCTPNTVTIANVNDGREPIGTSLGQDGRFRVTLDRVADTDVTVTFNVSGTGTEGTDYTTLTGTVMIPANSLSATIDVAVLPDSEDDSGETVILTLVGLSNPAVTLGSVSSATVTLFDGMLEGIAERLTSVLQDDFNQTIALQSRQFADMSQGALGRLHQAELGARCRSTDDADFDGDGAATAAASQIDATYRREQLDCAHAVRRLEYGSLAVSAIDGQSAQMMLTFGRAREAFREDQIEGRFLGGYLSTNAVDGDAAQGRIAGVGANLGLYSARKLGGNLYLDSYAAAAIGYHGYDLMFDEELRAEGNYSYLGLFAGAALSGEIAYNAALVRPRLGIDLGYGAAGRANVRAYTTAVSQSGFVTLDPAMGLRTYAELNIVFGEQLDTAAVQKGAPLLHSFGLTPRILCEDGFGTENAACGYGFGLEFSEIETARNIGWHVSLNADNVGDLTRGDIRISRERAFWNGAGAWSSEVTAGTAGDLSAAHGVKVTW